jgi:hypothetical protein
MAISPIAIATHGLLNSPLSVAAVRGKLTIDADTVAGSGITASPYMMPGPLWRQLQREDDDIVAIIAAFMEVMDE